MLTQYSAASVHFTAQHSVKQHFPGLRLALYLYLHRNHVPSDRPFSERHSSVCVRSFVLFYDVHYWENLHNTFAASAVNSGLQQAHFNKLPLTVC